MSEIPDFAGLNIVKPKSTPTIWWVGFWGLVTILAGVLVLGFVG